MRYSLLFGLMVLLLATGCQHTSEVAPDHAELAEPERTLVYIIHGDASYLYHSPDNRALQADEETVRRARHVAKNADDAEVLIFHQQSRSSLLGLFPRPDGAFYHYSGGQLIAEESYQRDPSGNGLQVEAQLYRQHRSRSASSRTLLYFGHELPDPPDQQYHHSYRDAPFGIAQLADGLAEFEETTDGDKPFELIVLSTCSNGTPATLAHLSPLTNYVLASPEDLHLSYMHSEPLHNVDADQSPRQTAERLAEYSFNRLQARVRTAVTVALYDVEALSPQIDELADSYQAIRPDTHAHVAEYVDCQDAGLEAASNVEGVDIWFSPPQFGQGSNRTSHSGWGCPVTPAWVTEQ